MRRGNADFVSVAPLTSLFIATNVVLFIVESMKSGSMEISSDVLIAMYGSLRERMWEGEWIRLIAPNFLHGGIIHILMNSMSLRSLGPAAELHFGSSNFGTIYLLSGVSGFCFSQIFGGHLAIGASASIFGLIGAELAVQLMRAPVLKHAWRNSEVKQMALWIGIYFLIGVSGMMGQIDNWAHLGGFLVGLLLATFFELWRRHSRIGLPLVVSVFLLVSGLAAAARWSVFNPYYHVHQAALAEKAGAKSEAALHDLKALEWAKFWKNEKGVRLIIDARKEGFWTVDDVYVYGYKYLPEWVYYKIQTQQRSVE